MPQISKITLPSGSTYDLKDAQAREDIEAIESMVTGGMHYIGVTTTVLSDGSTTNPIKINNVDVTAKSGDIVMYGNLEFVWADSDNKWHEFGSTGSLKALAFKDSASGSYKPQGTVSQPTFTGSSSTVTITATDNTSGNYQPKGTVSQPTFTGSSSTFTGNFTPSGSVSVTTKTTSDQDVEISAAAPGSGETATYTPAGTVSRPTFTGNGLTSTGKFTPAGRVNLSNTDKYVVVGQANSGAYTPGTTSTTYTPKGFVNAPTITKHVAGSTTTIKNPTSSTVAKTVVAAAPGATAPSNNLTYYSVADETLSLYQLGYTTGASITTSDVTVKTGDATYTASAPVFQGNTARLVTAVFSVPESATFAGNQGNVSVSGTPSGTVSAPTFTGTGVKLSGTAAVPSTYDATFSGTQGNVSVSGTPNGSVSQPTFTGTKAQLSGTTTASGSVSQPTFTGTSKTVTVS